MRTGTLSVSVEMLEGHTSRKVYALDLPDGSRIRLNLTKAKKHSSGGRHYSSEKELAAESPDPPNLLTEERLHPWQSIRVRAAKRKTAVHAAKSGGGGGSKKQQPQAASASSSHQRQHTWDVHDLKVLDDNTTRATSASAATGIRRRRRLAQQAASASPYSSPTMPYSPKIIFALMSNCGGPLPTSMAAMSEVLFGSSSAPQNQSFSGWNQACSYGQVTIVPGSVVVKEVRLSFRLGAELPSSCGRIRPGQITIAPARQHCCVQVMGMIFFQPFPRPPSACSAPLPSGQHLHPYSGPRLVHRLL